MEKKAVALLIFGLKILLLAAAPVTAQTIRQKPRITILGYGVRRDVLPEFLQALNKLGYKEGHNILIERRFADGSAERLANQAADFASRKMAVIIAVGPLAVDAAAKASKTIPIVMLGGGDPIHRGFVKSLTVPGGNITGLSGSPSGSGAITKRMELFKESIPSIRRAVMLVPETRPARVSKSYTSVAQGFGIDLQSVTLARDTEIEASFAKMKALRPDALIVLQERATESHAARIGEFAIAHRLPSMFESSLPVGAGGLMSYGPNQQMQARRAAVFVDKILKGAKPADIPVEPSPMEFVINLRTAKQLGVTIPPQILLEANKVIR